MIYNHYVLTADIYERTDKGLAWIREQEEIRQFKTETEGLKYCRKAYGLPLDLHGLELATKDRAGQILIYMLVNKHNSRVIGYYTKEDHNDTI